MANRILNNIGEPIFHEGCEEYALGLLYSGLIGMIVVFPILSITLNSLLADSGPGVYYSGAPFAVCTPDVVLYSWFLVGLTSVLLSLGYIAYQTYNYGFGDNVKAAWGVFTSGFFSLFFSSMLIYAIEGRLYLLPAC